jgi:acyl-CoA synthetase (NDP forming)
MTAIKVLTELESKMILEEAGIPITKTHLARTKKDAKLISKEIGFPVVLKVSSVDLSHKSDAGGVALNLKNQNQVAAAYDRIINSVKTAHPGVNIEGITVQKMVSEGIEVIIGMSRDPQFGPVIMFGLGGVFVELLKDVAFRVAPLSEKDAWEMLTEVKGYPLLKGYRGMSPANQEALADVLIKLSKLAELHPEFKEVDINPLFVNTKTVIGADARIVIEQ